MTTTREITAVLRGLKGKKSFTVALVRARKEMSLTVTIEERNSGNSGATRAGIVWVGDLPVVQVQLPEVVVKLPEIHLPEVHVHTGRRGEI